ncbi:hypothetical protein ARMSODRAFT_963521 [Armillaria solidipes]|uniref:Uncharacterized protein n=1 Tax=Armillaria solidipes TaxID=1076256 RepID=A0A2H3BGN6_9AGAR|nr:hypothetical protein ARMSODRAFT_963521 [Armillaria solidipes]
MVSQILLELSLTLILITLDSIRLFDFGCWRWYELCSILMVRIIYNIFHSIADLDYLDRMSRGIRSSSGDFTVER